jgi:hypothetical protein
VKPWIRPRYYCANVAECRHAKADRVFTAQEYARDSGLCRGPDGTGCGRALKAGAPIDLRPRWAAVALAGLLVAAASGWTVRTWVFPPPLEHVAFALRESETPDDAGLVDVEIVRGADLRSALTIDYVLIEGSAKAGQDYTAGGGRLVFGPGESRKRLSVAVLPDTSFQKERRHFSLALLNVRGEPRHVVHIVPRQVARSDARVAEQSVRAASVIAKDIADLVVRQRVLDQLLTASREQAGEFAEYRKSLASVNGNLSRARESYLQMLRELQVQQPAIVLGAMDRVADDLQRRTFDQQARAVTIMKRHFTELLHQRSADMDRWAHELSMVVPPARGSPPAPST